MAYQLPPNPNNDDPWLVRLMSEIGNIKLILERVMPRSEIEAADAKRVLHETYLADMRGVYERLTRLEGGSGRLIAWLGAIFGGIGCLGTLLSMMGIIFTIIWTIAQHAH